MSGEPAEPPHGPEDEWRTPVELAAREGCSRSTIWRWVRRGIVQRRALGPRTGVQLRLRPAAARVNLESWAARCPLCGCRCSVGPPVPDATWRTVGEFAARHRISVSSVRRWCRMGRLHTQRIDGRLRVRLLDERSWGH